MSAKLLNPKSEALESYILDMAPTLVSHPGRGNRGELRGQFAHRIARVTGLASFGALTNPDMHERLSELCVTYRTFPGQNAFRLDSNTLPHFSTRVGCLIGTKANDVELTHAVFKRTLNKATSSNANTMARELYVGAYGGATKPLKRKLELAKHAEILGLISTDTETNELIAELLARGHTEDEIMVDLNKSFDISESLLLAASERKQGVLQPSQPQPQPQPMLQPQPQPMSQPQRLLALQQLATYALIDNLDVNDLVGMISSPLLQPQLRPLSQPQPLLQTSAQPAVPPIIDDVQLRDNLSDDLGLPPPQASFTAAFGTLGGGLGGGLSGRKKKPLPPTNEWGGKYTVVPRPPFAALPQQLLPTESVVSGSIVLAPEVESPGAYGAGLGAGFGADFGNFGGLDALLDSTLGGSTVMGRGMAWHDGHGMAAPAPGLEPLFGLGPLSRLTELTPIGPDGAQPGAAFHEAPEPRLPSRAGSSRTSRLVTEGELARVASEAHARGFASGAAAGSAHGLVKCMEIGASVASKAAGSLG